MSTVYFEDAASSDLNLNTVTAPANSQKLVQSAAGSASSVTVTLPASGTNLEHWWITEPGDPGASGGTGAQTYSGAIAITTANMNVSGTLTIHRLNSVGVSQASVLVKTIALAGTGAAPFSTSAANLGTFASGDRFGLQLVATNGAMSTQSVVLEVGLANGNEQVTAPWTAMGYRTAADTLGTTDAATRSTARVRTANDTLGTSDTTTGVRITTYIKTAADTLGTTDAATRSALIRTRTTADTLGTTDSAVRSALLLARTAADALGTTDFATRSDLLIRAAADVLGTSDAATRLRIEPRAAADTLGTADVATRLALLLRTAADTLATSDTASGFAGKRSATDTLGTTDAATRLIIAARLTADALGTTDAATRLALAIRTAADTLGTTDAATRAALLRSRTASDTLGTSDAATRAALQRLRTAADTLGTSDAATRVRLSFRTAADALGTTDAALAQRFVARFASDALGTTDLAARLAILYRTALDTLGTNDSADAIVSFVTAPDLNGPLHVLVLSGVSGASADTYLAKSIVTDFVAHSTADEPSAKGVAFEPVDKAIPDSYAGKAS